MSGRLKFSLAYERGHHLYYSAVAATLAGRPRPDGCPIEVWFRAKADTNTFRTVSLSESWRRAVGPKLEPFNVPTWLDAILPKAEP